jgi:glutamine amidotransferase
MRKNVVILDYGLGNIFSIFQACEYVGYNVEVTCDPDKVLKADALILPGVGAFGNAMESLRKNDLISPIGEFVKSGRPFLGICLGMQLLFTKSEEHGNHNGLNFIEGDIIKFPDYDINNKFRVPQTQWNRVYQSDVLKWRDTPFKEVEDGEYMYFVHSYYALPKDKGVVLAYTDYAKIKYASAVVKENILGIQFHPEKSSIQGLKIYRDWLK